MSGFVRRYPYMPTNEQIRAIEGVIIADLPPQYPAVGIGTGTVLVVGEFEDGPFNNSTEVITDQSLSTIFGGFGYQYGGAIAQNASARQRNFELWNGNGYLRASLLRATRKIVIRVDTSVGEVAFSPRASIKGNIGPFSLAAGQQIAITTSVGTGSSTALAAVAASVTSSVAFTNSGFTGGESIDVRIDNSPTIRVVFSSADQTPAQVAARINSTVGTFVAASVTVGAGNGVRITGIIQGTAGRVVVANAVGTPLTALSIAAGTTSGTGNVANINAVTAAEIQAIMAGTAALTTINAYSVVDADGSLRVFDSTASGGTINVTSGPMSLLVFPAASLGVTVANGVFTGGTIPAGTRVRTAGGDTWVTMQSIAVPSGTAAAPNTNAYAVKVRPALDNGSGPGAAAAAITTLVDPISFNFYVVSNPQALSVPLNENQLDSRYQTALNASLDARNLLNKTINILVCARQSLATARACKTSVVDASAQGFYGRDFIARAPLGFTEAQAYAFLEQIGRSQRQAFTYPGVQVRIPQIGEVGTAGGLGFTATGNINIGFDIAVGTLSASLPPEENIGQQTNLVDNFFAVEDGAPVLNISSYEAARRNGVMMPRIDPTSGTIVQSAVTTDLTPALVNWSRRRSADFIQDSLAIELMPYCKKLGTPSRREAIYAAMDGFLSGLVDAERIASYSIDATSGQTPELIAQGIYVWDIKVRLLSSMDFLVIRTEIGEGVITATVL